MSTPSINAANLIAALARFGRALPTVVEGVSEDDARWRPDDGAWSIVEIVAHLADEEVEDFRTRLRMTLEDPTQDWPPIDPEGVAVTRRYRERDLAAEVQRFADSRAESIQWLGSLRDADWSTARVHPKFGAMYAGDLLGAWAAHDALHLRQIAKRLHQLARRDAGGFDTAYAGQWGA